MSKKRMVASEFNTVSVNADGKPVDTPVQADPNATAADKIKDAGDGLVNLTQAKLSKLEEVEKLEKVVAALTSENEALKAKLAEYIEELDAFRSRKPEVKEVIKEIVKEVPAKVDGSDEVKKLREENDAYLMRISELTFENAKLTASLSEVRKPAPEPSTPPNVKPYANVYRNSAGMNGYASWN